MTMKPRVERAVRRLVSAPALLAISAFAGACDNPYAQKAAYPNSDQSFTVHALSGTPLAYPTALSFPARSTTHVDGTLAFDVAFDIDSAGNVVYLPVKMVGENPAGDMAVGIQRAAGTYDQVSSAPLSGYTIDSVTVAKVGQPVVVQAQASMCALTLTPYIYAKIVVDSIDLPTRALFGRTMINLNCGFRQLVSGYPTF